MRNLLLFFSLFISACLLYANEKGGVVLEQMDGKRVIYAFSQKPCVTYSGETLVMTTNKVIVEYPLSSLSGMTFTDDASNAVEAPLTVTPSVADEYQIYTLDGKLIRRSGEGKPLSTHGLRAGTYIIRTPQYSYKITLK